MIAGDMPNNTKFTNFNKKYIQIILSNETRNKEDYKLLYRIKEMDVDSKREDVFNEDIVYDFNLEYYKKEMYNKGKLSENEKYFALFVESKKEKLRKIYKKGEMKKMYENVESLQNDLSFLFDYDHELYQRNVLECEIETKFKEEKTNTLIETAKTLLKFGKNTIEEISEATGLPIEEIKKIEKN